MFVESCAARRRARDQPDTQYAGHRLHALRHGGDARSPVDGLRGDARGYSNHMTVARITYSPTNAAPSNRSASPSPVICHMARAVTTSAPIKTGLSTNVRCVVNASESRTSAG